MWNRILFHILEMTLNGALNSQLRKLKIANFGDFWAKFAAHSKIGLKKADFDQISPQAKFGLKSQGIPNTFGEISKELRQKCSVKVLNLQFSLENWRFPFPIHVEPTILAKIVKFWRFLACKIPGTEGKASPGQSRL